MLFESALQQSRFGVYAPRILKKVGSHHNVSRIYLFATMPELFVEEQIEQMVRIARRLW